MIRPTAKIKAVIFAVLIAGAGLFGFQIGGLRHAKQELKDTTDSIGEARDLRLRSSRDLPERVLDMEDRGYRD